MQVFFSYLQCREAQGYLLSSNLDTSVNKTHLTGLIIKSESINLNPMGNIESFGSLINSTLTVEIVKGSIKLFTFVKSLLVSSNSSIVAASTTKGFELIFSLYWNFFSF